MSYNAPQSERSVPHYATSGIPLSKLETKLMEIRSYHVNWESYRSGGMISDGDYEFIKKLDHKPNEERDALIDNEAEKCVLTFLNLLSHVAKDHVILYSLVLLDDSIRENSGRVSEFHKVAAKNNVNIWAPFLNLLNNSDDVIMHMASRIFTKLACRSQYRCPETDLNYYLNWLKTQLVMPGSEYVLSVATCLQWVLRVDEYRVPFVKADGINSILSVLLGNIGFQLQYQLIFSFWMLAFNHKTVEQINKNNVIPVLADTLRDSQKEKVTRIVMATLRKLLENTEDVKMSAVIMIQCKILPVVNVLSNKNWGDEDVKDDVDYVLDKLNTSVSDLSTFDEYVAEVRSGRLEWSPVHKSEKFWRENGIRLTENNYELVKILVKLLESSQDPLILAVSCHDLGEFIRHYHRGKSVFDALGGKQLIMRRLSHEDSQVKYEALVAIQKMMVHNWEFLGKQLKVE